MGVAVVGGVARVVDLGAGVALVGVARVGLRVDGLSQDRQGALALELNAVVGRLGGAPLDAAVGVVGGADLGLGAGRLDRGGLAADQALDVGSGGLGRQGLAVVDLGGARGADLKRGLLDGDGLGCSSRALKVG